MSSNSLTPCRSNQILGLVFAMSGVAALYLGLIPSLSADEHDKKTTITFSAPVEVPGKALPAGTYVFKLLDSTANRNIVQIFDKDEKTLYATILAIPDYRLQPSDKPVIQFEERPAGSPPAIKAFFYPGDTYGQQFVYPHKRAVELAKRTHQNVLSMNDNQTATISTKATSASDAGIKEMQNTEVSGVSGSGDPIAVDVIILTTPQR
jgi:hypothetical protein